MEPLKPSNVIRVGIIGAGRMGSRHAQVYSGLPGVKIAAVVDPDPVAAGKLANVFHAESHKSSEGMYSNVPVDAVSVCTPTRFHFEEVSTALECKKHVLCEKPLTLRSDELSEIAEAEEKSGKRVIVGYSYRFHPALIRTKKLIDTSAIGAPTLVLMRIGGRGGHRPWLHQSMEGGGAINELAIHMIDLVSWYFGPPLSGRILDKSTLLRLRRFGNRDVPISAEDFAILEFTTKQGIKVIVQADQLTPSYMNHIEILGTHGSIFASILERLPFVICKSRDRGTSSISVNRFRHVNLLHKEIMYFLQVVRNSRDSTINTVSDSASILDALRLVFQEQQ